MSRELNTSRGISSPVPGGSGASRSSATGNSRGIVLPGDAAAADAAHESPRNALARSEQLKEELDDIVASECVLCGDIMIRSIDHPFIGDDELDVVSSWAI